MFKVADKDRTNRMATKAFPPLGTGLQHKVYNQVQTQMDSPSLLLGQKIMKIISIWKTLLFVLEEQLKLALKFVLETQLFCMADVSKAVQTDVTPKVDKVASLANRYHQVRLAS